jgi:hypothetical protein
VNSSQPTEKSRNFGGDQLVRTRGHLKVCALNNGNSDKCGTRVSNGPVAFAQLRFQIPAMSRTASCSEAKPPEMNIRQSSAPLNFPHIFRKG